MENITRHDLASGYNCHSHLIPA